MEENAVAITATTSSSGDPSKTTISAFIMAI
jgi:hypothetical protein